MKRTLTYNNHDTNNNDRFNILVCRAIGLPARSITNFASAHDTDGSTCIDKAFVKKGEDLEKVDIEGSSDSIWYAYTF